MKSKKMWGAWILFALAALLCLGIVAGKKAPSVSQSAYNSQDRFAYSYEQAAVTLDEASGTIRASNVAEGWDISLPRNPCASETMNKSGIFGCGSEVYLLGEYTAGKAFQVLDAEGEAPVLSLYEFDLKTLEEKVVFSTANFLYTNQDQQVLNQAATLYFFLNSDFLYLVSDKVWEVNRMTGQMALLPIDCSYGNLAFDGTAMYYTGQDAHLYAYNTKAKTSAAVGNLAVKDFFLAGDCIFYLNRLDGQKVYVYSLQTQESKKVIDCPATAIFSRDNKIVFFSQEDGRAYRANLNGDSIQRYEGQI